MKNQILSIKQMQHLKDLGVDTSKASIKAVPLGITDFSSRDVLSWKEVSENAKGELKYRKKHIAKTLEYNVEIEYVDMKGKHYEDYNDGYVFTLQDIINMLPKVIIEKDMDGETHYYRLRAEYWEFDECWSVSYSYSDEFDNLELFESKSLLDAAYEMLCWCAENGYLKGGNE